MKNECDSVSQRQPHVSLRKLFLLGQNSSRLQAMTTCLGDMSIAAYVHTQKANQRQNAEEAKHKEGTEPERGSRGKRKSAEASNQAAKSKTGQNPSRQMRTKDYMTSYARDKDMHSQKIYEHKDKTGHTCRKKLQI